MVHIQAELRSQRSGRTLADALILHWICGVWLLLGSACQQSIPSLEPGNPDQTVGKTLSPPGASIRDAGCRSCHAGASSGLTGPHDPSVLGCVLCHQGNGEALDQASAHAGLDAFPGHLATADRSCGRASCHAEVLEQVRRSPMATQAGLRSLTRAWLSPGASAVSAGHAGLPSRLAGLVGPLELDGVDDYLRRLCASCHLGQPRTQHTLKTTDRGGGCSACHLEGPGLEGVQPGAVGGGAPATHPGLTAAPEDARCFGCHSRSGRISLSYVGLVERATTDPKGKSSVSDPLVGYLADGRAVAQRAPDVHSQAGMGCIDCHTQRELMGKEAGAPVILQRDALEIQCTDCHAAQVRTQPLKTLDQATQLRAARRGLGLSGESPVVVTERGASALLQLAETPAGRTLLTRREGKRLTVPVPGPQSHRLESAHARLTCESCHAGWAPWCAGCHIEYDPAGRQWDHEAQAERSGSWIETAWGVDAAPPALGVDHQGRIAPFVPGMHLTLGEKGSKKSMLERRLYARSSPHTTGKTARSCESCHSDPAVLGIRPPGQGGRASAGQGGARGPGWVDAQSNEPAPGLHPGDRSLNQVERQRVAQVGQCLPCHPGSSGIYDDFQAGLKRLASPRSRNGSDPHSGLLNKENGR